MKLRHTLVFGLAVAALAACSDDEGKTTLQPGPKAFVRFVNAVPDTGTVDFRFVDHVENLPSFLGVAFRANSGAGFTAVDPGTRPVRVFVSDTVVTTTTVRLIDTTLTLTAGSRYTLVYAGRARGNQDRLAVIDEDATLPSPTGLAVRAFHAAVGTGPVDVFVGNGGSDPITATVTKLSNVAYLGKTAYANIPVRPTGATNLYAFAVTNAGTTTALFSATPNQPGIPTPAGQIYSPQPGVQIAGSVLTAIVFPGATAGSRAATAANLNPTVQLLIDKVLQ
jgi:uncharacterized protein DUF4397